MNSVTGEQIGTGRNWTHLFLLALLIVPLFLGGILPALSGGILSGGILSGGIVIDMAMSGQPGSIPWNVTDAKPGSHGEGSVNVTNTGTIDRSLYIWVGNITGDNNLGKYILFNISHPRLIRTVSLPSTVYNLPQSPSDSRLVVIPVPAGETVTVTWTWEFRETGEPQNEAQGKKLGFVIYYTMKAPLTAPEGWQNVTPPGERALPQPGTLSVR